MGNKIGTFKNIDNETIKVTFSGNKVAGGNIKFSPQPVVLAMGGEAGKFEPVSYITGTINIMALGTECLDLFASNVTDIKVTVKNETTGELLFAGFVSPNTFAQSVSSRYNELAIEVVDYLGACKFLNYPFDGLRVRSLREMITRILAAYFPDITELYAPPTLYLMPGDGAVPADGTNRWLEMSASEIALVDSPDPYLPAIYEAGGSDVVKFPNEDVSCFDVLEKIANSVLFTLVQRGAAWHFVDALQVVAGDTTAHRYSTTDGWATASGELVQARGSDTYVVAETDAVGAGVAYSVVQKKRKAIIKNGYEERIRLFPALFDDGQLKVTGKAEHRTRKDDDKIKDYLVGDVTPTGYYLRELSYGEDGDYRGAKITAQADFESDWGSRAQVASTLSPVLSWRKNLFLYIDKSAKNAGVLLLRKKLQFPVGVAARPGIGLYISARWSVAEGFVDEVPKELASTDDYKVLLWARVKVGDYDFISPAVDDGQGRKPHWVNGAAVPDNLVWFLIDGKETDEWRWRSHSATGNNNYIGQSEPAGDIAVPDLYDYDYYTTAGGDVTVEIYGANAFNGKDTTVIVSDFEVGFCAGHEQLCTYTAQELQSDTTLVDEAVEGDEVEHELPFNVAWPCSSGYLSPVVGGALYASQVYVQLVDGLKGSRGWRSKFEYYEKPDNAASGYGSSVHRLLRLANQGGAYSTEIEVRDGVVAGKAVEAYTRVRINGQNKRIVSFEKDIKNKSAQIKLL